MIIKSLSRKKPSFEQLYNYMIDGAEQKHFIISKNLYNTDKERVLLQFKENSKLLPKRKNGVFLYHEIISLPEQKEIPKKKQKEMLCDIANTYLEKRTGLNLAFGTIHEEKDHLHCHLMISSNELNSPQRQRLSKEEFSRIQKEIESYKLEKFPELHDKTLYNKEMTRNKYQTAKSKDRESQYKYRTKEKSRTEILQEKLKQAFLKSYSLEEFKTYLKTQNIEFYARGNTFGVVDIAEKHKGVKKCKFRFKRLGLENEFENLLQFEKAREKEIEKIKEIQKKTSKIEREK